MSTFNRASARGGKSGSAHRAPANESGAVPALQAAPYGSHSPLQMLGFIGRTFGASGHQAKVVGKRQRRIGAAVYPGIAHWC